MAQKQAEYEAQLGQIMDIEKNLQSSLMTELNESRRENQQLHKEVQ